MNNSVLSCEKTARINILNKYKSTPLSSQRVPAPQNNLGMVAMETNQSLYVTLEKNSDEETKLKVDIEIPVIQTQVSL